MHAPRNAIEVMHGPTSDAPGEMMMEGGDREVFDRCRQGVRFERHLLTVLELAESLG